MLIGISLALAGCGGGGGSRAPAPNPTPTPPPEPANNAPSADFMVDTNSGPAPFFVTVNASASADSDGTISSYEWDFAGTTAIGIVAQHTFDMPGTYNISLTVTDDDGATDTIVRSVIAEQSSNNATLSGTAHILSSTAVDADVHDRLTLQGNNNNFDQAQSLTAPVIVGGFANTPMTGETNGNLFNSGDPGDFYQLNLNGNETVVLEIAEQAADLDLRLWDSNRNLVDASLGDAGTAIESVEVPVAGTYFIEVKPYAGASNYVLRVGQNTPSSIGPREPTRISDPFVTNQFIVKSASTSNANAPNMRTISPRTNSPKITNTARFNAAPGLYAAIEDKGAHIRVPQKGNVSPLHMRRMQTLYKLKNMRRDVQIQHVELNLLRQSSATPDDTFFTSQWHYQAINLPTAWDTSTGDASVIVAIIDTGVLLNHQDLNGKLVAGYDFISDANRAGDGDGIDSDPNDSGDGELVGSSSFHGTHVAGTVGAASNNGSGVAGVAWQTRLMPLRVLGQGGGTTFDIIQAVRFAAGLSNNSNTLPQQRADVINLSLGGSFSSQSEQDAYTEAAQAGVIIIAAAGNERTSLPRYPASYDDVISVSATTINNSQAPYSNSGASIDVAAPGGSNLTDLNGDGVSDGVVSTIGDDSAGGPVKLGYGTLSGTSMAAPHVAGVVALMKAIHPALSPAQFNAALINGDLTDDLGAAGRDDIFGYGLINAQKAVFTAQNFANGQGVDPGPILASSSSILNFGSLADTLTLTLRNLGTGDIATVTPSSSVPWLSVTPPSASTLGEYTISIDRMGLADGAYQGNLQFTSNVNSVSVDIIMQVSSFNDSANAGLFYFILVDENDDTVGGAEFVDAQQGAYPFTLTNVPPGQYRLFAGTDADDDSFLCDAGEACGGFPTLDSPQFIDVSGDLDDLDFEVLFRATFGAASAQSQESVRPSNGFHIRKAQGDNR